MLHRRDEQCTDLLCSISAVQASVWSICTANTQVVGRASLDHFSDCIFLLCICFQDGSGGSFTKGSELLWKKVESECESALRMNSVGRFGVSAPAAAMLSPSSWATSVLLLSFLSNSAEVSRNSEKHRKIRREIISSFVNCNSGEMSWAAAAESFSEGPQVKLRPPSQFKLDCYQHPLVLWGGVYAYKTRMWDLQNQHHLPVSTYQFLPAAPGSDCCRSPAAITNTQLYLFSPFTLLSRSLVFNQLSSRPVLRWWSSSGSRCRCCTSPRWAVWVPGTGTGCVGGRCWKKANWVSRFCLKQHFSLK